MVTLSVIKADVGGYPGHAGMHPDIMKTAENELKKQKILTDFRVMHCGDDLELIMTHNEGIDNEKVHKLAWDVFVAATAVAKKLKLYGAGQDLLSDSFSGNVKGMGPGVAEMQFEERKSEPIIVFMADKTSAGSWNLPLYKMFADPFNTAGLIIDPTMNEGFDFEVHDVIEHKRIIMHCPDEAYEMLAFIGSPDRYCVKHVIKGKEVVACSSTQKLSLIAGKYVGKDDPVCIVRSQSGLPAVGEVLEPFAFPQLVMGWMRGSHHGPLMPVGFKNAICTRFDGPPRVIAAGFQLANGKLVGPADLFDDPAYDLARKQANKIGEYMRRHGPFEPHRLPMTVMEYTSLPKVEEKLKDRWEKI